MPTPIVNFYPCALTVMGGGAVLVFGAKNVAATTATRYLFPSYSDTAAMTAPGGPDTPPSYRVPKAGTIRKMYVRQNDPKGNGEDIVYTLRKNGIATGLTATLASTDYDASDLVNSVVVAQGDLLDVEVTKALSVGTSPTDLFVTMEFV